MVDLEDPPAGSGKEPGVNNFVGVLHVQDKSRVQVGNTINHYAFPQSSAPHFYVPFGPNEAFVSRKDICSKLGTLLPFSNKRRQTVTISGPAGAGKTQIVLNFVYRLVEKNPKCHAFWVNGGSEASFVKDYMRIARDANLLKPGKSTDEILQSVCSFIRSLSEFVFVVDNADDLKIFGKNRSYHERSRRCPEDSCCDLDDFIPKGPTGTIIWMSRDRSIREAIGSRDRWIEIEHMSLREAQDLFQAFSGKDKEEFDSEDTIAVLAELECLPLAVSQAAKYISRMNISSSKYLQDIQEEKKRYVRFRYSEIDAFRDRETPNTVFYTWGITMNTLRHDCFLASCLMRMLSFVSNENIPLQLIHKMAESLINEEIFDPYSRMRFNFENEDHVQKSSDSVDLSDDHVDEAIARLEEFYILNERPGDRCNRVFDIHTLVHEIARLDTEQFRVGPGFSTLALQSVTTLFPKKPWHDQNLDSCEQYLQHMQHSIRHLVIDNPDRLSYNDLGLASLVANTGYAYLDFRFRPQELRAMTGAFCSSVERLLGYGLQSGESLHPKHELLIARCLHLRGESERAHSKTLGLLRDSEDPSKEIHKFALPLQELHAEILVDMGKPEAEKAFWRSCQMREKLFGTTDLRTLEWKLVFARLFIDNGWVLFEPRSILAEQVEPYLWSTKDASDPETYFDLYWGLGAVFRDLNELDKATTCLLAALNMASRIGEENPGRLIGRPLSLLAQIAQLRGWDNLAWTLSCQALKLHQQGYGLRQKDTLQAVAHHCSILNVQGHPVVAEEMAKEALEVMRRERDFQEFGFYYDLVIQHSLARYSQSHVIDAMAILRESLEYKGCDHSVKKYLERIPKIQLELMEATHGLD